MVIRENCNLRFGQMIWRHVFVHSSGLKNCKSKLFRNNRPPLLRSSLLQVRLFASNFKVAAAAWWKKIWVKKILSETLKLIFESLFIVLTKTELLLVKPCNEFFFVSWAIFRRLNIFFCSTSLPLASTRLAQSIFSNHNPLSSKQRF